MVGAAGASAAAPVAGGQLGDFVWSDLNGNGVQDSGEPGVAGVQVVLFDPSGEILRTTTGSNGRYLFTGLAWGEYSVGFEGLPEGAAFTNSDGTWDQTRNSDADQATGRTQFVPIVSSNPYNTTLDAGLIYPPQ